MYPTQANRARTATTSRALANRIRILPVSVGGVRLDLEIVEQFGVQVEQGVKVGPPVALLLAQQTGVDQVEDDLADVVGPVDAPQPEYDAGHPAELAAG